MNNQHLLAAVAAVALTAGCTATLNGAVTPGSAGAAGSTTATGGTSTSTTVSTGMTTGALADLYKLGRVWEYAVTSGGTTSTQRQEVTDVKDNKATVKTTTTVLGQTNSSTSIVDLTKSDATASIPLEANTTFTLNGTPTAESITVKAGTFDVMHGKGTTKTTAGGSNVSSDFEFWTSTKVGLVKSVTTTKLDVAIPNVPSVPGVSIPGLPTGGASGNLTTTLELTKFQ